MASFVTAYLIVWVFTALYVLRLRAAQQRTLRRLETLERLLDEGLPQSGHSRAA